MGSRHPGAMVAMRTTCPFSGSRRSGLMWMPGPIASLSSGIWSMLTVSRSSCGKATNGSGTPLLVRNMPGETGAVMVRPFNRTDLRIATQISGLHRLQYCDCRLSARADLQPVESLRGLASGHASAAVHIYVCITRYLDHAVTVL